MKKRQSHLLMIDSTLDLVHRVLFSSQDSAQAAADFDGNIYPFLFRVMLADCDNHSHVGVGRPTTHKLALLIKWFAAGLLFTLEVDADHLF